MATVEYISWDVPPSSSSFPPLVAAQTSGGWYGSVIWGATCWSCMEGKVYVAIYVSCTVSSTGNYICNIIKCNYAIELHGFTYIMYIAIYM